VKVTEKLKEKAVDEAKAWLLVGLYIYVFQGLVTGIWSPW